MKGIQLSDNELLRRLMYLKRWNQDTLGREIGISQAQVSHVINDRKNLGRSARILAERILEEADEEKQEETA